MNCYKCGHSKNEHMPSGAYAGEFFCMACFNEHYSMDVPAIKNTTDAYHKYPDNLDLIEHLAKERNLI